MFASSIVDDGVASSFQIVSDNPTATSGFDDCVEKKSDWNAYECTRNSNEARQSVLIFEGINSQDVVEEDRDLQPVDVFGLGHSYINVVNSMMDHGWDGFYSSQKRLQRFPILIEAGKDYTIDTEGTPTEKLRFLLNSKEGATEGSMIRVLYDNVGKKTVKANGQVIQPQLFDDETRQPKELDRLVCGENRLMTLTNYLEFFITPGCEILVEPNDSIEGAVRMDWTLTEFYSQ